MAVNEMVISQVAVQDVQADVVVVRVLEDGSFARGLQALDEVSGGFFARQAKLGNLPRKVGRAVMFVEVEGVEAQRVLVVCADKKKKDLKKAVAQVLEEVKRFECATVALAMFDGVAEREAQLALQWVLGGCYAFEECKSESKLKDGDFSLAQVRWVVCVCEKGRSSWRGLWRGRWPGLKGRF
ncbi:M17 family peptidase N-terminal domain-containing protein [Rappaport israeli]|uniref:M17 family peptidase N-terminal domain-containing protein n=1 Tax=Rappaport israeli TaxID=1839807 RepID=UPI00098F6E9C|nr:M17 family peptidase N-terminal domain-containing protein [Rappaport israeli]